MAAEERAAQLGTKVRTTGVTRLLTWEFSCPSCGTLLEVDNYEAGERPDRDIRLGETRSDEGEAF